MTGPVRRAGLTLGLFAILAMGAVAWVERGTRERIDGNQRRTLLHTLDQVLAAEEYDNDIVSDVIEVKDLLPGPARPLPAFRARRHGQPVAVVLAPVAADGYGGDIRLLAAVRGDGSLAGVRVLAHRETPGLGDAIDAAKSGWILRFRGRSLADPPEPQWKVKRDGGAFDQFAGATVTPRAVVNALRNTLRYVRSHWTELFDRPSSATAAPLAELAER